MKLIEQRLYPDSVPGQKQPLFAAFPDCEGKDSIEPLQASFSPPGIGMKQYLRVRVPLKDMAEASQFLPDFLCIIQLSIIGKGVVLTSEVQFHGLFSTIRIDNRKACMEQRAQPLAINSFRVRSPPCHGSQHFGQHCF